MFRSVFHISVLVLNSFTMWYDQKYVDLPYAADGYDKMIFKGRLAFLTIWCFILQTVYFTTSLLNDHFGTNAPAPKKTSLIRSIKDLIFSIAFSVALFVSIMFWGLYAINKELVFPEIMEKVCPSWVNHTWHTLITVFMFTELFVTNRTYVSRKIGIFVIVTFILSYIVWIHELNGRFGAWPYHILDVLNLPQRLVYFASCTAMFTGFYIIVEKLNNAVASKSSSIPQGRAKKNK